MAVGAKSHEQREHARGAAETTRSLGAAPLRESAPGMFDAQLRRYENLLDQAVEQQTHQVDRDTSEALREMAAQLGYLKSGPKDVIDIHKAALKNKLAHADHKKSRDYFEEARLMALELMGYLASFYRTYATGLDETGAGQDSAAGNQ